MSDLLDFTLSYIVFSKSLSGIFVEVLNFMDFYSFSAGVDKLAQVRLVMEENGKNAHAFKK